MLKLDPTKVHDQWQRLDRQLGLVMPWYTHPCLDEIAKWDLNGKRVHEWGGGCSTLWWAARGAQVYTIEAHQEWADWIAAECARRGFGNVTVVRRWPDPEDAYLEVEGRPDIVVVDGSSRTQCIAKALTLPRPLTLIVDNWQQDYVYIDEHAVALLAPYAGTAYAQSNHKDHKGRPWTTAIWKLEE